METVIVYTIVTENICFDHLFTELTDYANSSMTLCNSDKPRDTGSEQCPTKCVSLSKYNSDVEIVRNIKLEAVMM